MPISEIKQRIDAAVKDAMRARDKQRLGVLRLTMAEFKRIEVDERIDVGIATVVAAALPLLTPVPSPKASSSVVGAALLSVGAPSTTVTRSGAAPLLPVRPDTMESIMAKTKKIPAPI